MNTDEPWRYANAPDDNFEPDEEDFEDQRDPDELFDEHLGRWKAVGRELTEARLRLGISKREAARRADLSDGAWRHLEAGVKKAYGTMVLPNPRPENLIAAAKAVDLNPVILFELTRQRIPDELRFLTTPRATSFTTPTGETISLDGLADTDIDLITQLVERLRRNE